VLPDADPTAVVRPLDGALRLIVEYAVIAGARRVLYGRSWWPMPVLQRCGHWIDASVAESGPAV